MNQSQVIKQLDADTRTVKGLAEQGDRADIPRVIEHHFTAASEADLQALLRVGEMLGFEPAENEVAEKARLSADLLTEQPIELNARGRESLLMLALAEAFSCSYDGWGTFVTKRPDA